VTTLLRQIQDSAADHAVPVTDLLRKALILARRLDYQPLGDWAERELEGYPPDAELPEYRAYRECQVVGDFAGPMNSGRRNQPLPSGAVSEAHRRQLFGFELREGVPTYESLLESGNDLAIPWSGNFVVHYQQDFIELMALTAARRIVGRAELSQLIEAVRTRLLNFSLEIEAENPDAGEAEPGSHPIPATAVSEAFQVTVMGDNNVVNAAGRDATQTVSFDDGRWDQLRETLMTLGVPEEEVDALHVALQADADRALPAGTMGPSVAAWYERLNAAVAKGTMSLATEVAGGMIAVELLKFLGAG
jgi:hypothetical protein